MSVDVLFGLRAKLTGAGGVGSSAVRSETVATRVTNRTVSIVIASVVVAQIVFLATLRHETWDGTIFDYWLRTGDFRGVDVWYRESNGFVTLGLLSLVDISDRFAAFLADTNLINISAVILYTAGAYMVLGAIGSERRVRLLGTLILALSPVVLLAASMMNALILIYTAFCWIGLSLLRRGGWRSVVAILLLALSCQLWSNFAVISAFLAGSVVTTRQIGWAEVAAGIVCSSMIYVLLFQVELSGAYIGYNSISEFSVSGLWSAFVSSSYLRTITPVFACAVLATVVAALVRRQFVTADWLALAWAMLLFVSAAIPYLVVGKDSLPYGIIPNRSGFGQFTTQNNYDYRNVVPALVWLSAAVSLIIVRGLDVIDALGRFRKLFLGVAGAVAVLLLSSNALNSLQFAEHLHQRDEETVALVAQLTAMCNALERSCIVDLAAVPTYLADVPRFYELSYLYYMAFGRLGILLETGDREGMLAAAQSYGCSSEAHAINYLMPFEICQP